MNKTDFFVEVKKFLEISEQQFHKLSNFVNFLEQKNNEINLVSKKAASELWSKHVLDCIYIYKFINKNILSNKKIADFGSGAGFPGIVLAIINEDSNFYLFESISKKCNFLNEVISLLNLKNVVVINQRIENFKSNFHFDIITSRAMSNTEIIFKISKHLITKNSTYFLYKGPSYVLENNENFLWKIKNIYNYKLKNEWETVERFILEIKQDFKSV